MDGQHESSWTSGNATTHINEWLGDWLAPVPADDYLIFNAFHYRNAALMEKFAVLTGNAEGQKKYHQIAERDKEILERYLYR